MNHRGSPSEGRAGVPPAREDVAACEVIAAELIRTLRGRRSQAALSRLLGYRSNIVNRWESGEAFPTAARFLGIVHRLRPERGPVLWQLFVRQPSALTALEPTSSQAVAAFLRELRGRSPISSIAEEAGFNRYSVSRWLSGASEPRLPQFLRLMDVMSRRLLDFIGLCVDPEKVPSVAPSWRRLQLSREAAYDMPWSHAVLRALELGNSSQHRRALAERLGVAVEEMGPAIDLLEKAGQIKKVRGKWRLQQVISVNTAHDPERAAGLKIFWTEVALERMRRGAPGNFGYSLFAITQSDIRRLRDLHLEYVRAMQNVIANSKPGECVGLYCAQLMDLADANNALK